MSEANEERGEHELVLANTAYPLRPSFTAIVAIEKRTDRSLLDLTRAASGGTLTFTQIGIVASELIKAGATDDLNKRVSADRVGQLVYEEGLGVVLPVLTMCLLGAVNGGRTASGEWKAPAAAPDPSETAGAE